MKPVYLIVFIAAVAITGCSGKKTPVAELINQQASLPGNLPYNPFQWGVITSGLNNKESTMHTLYGNDAALKYARSNAQHDYSTDSVLCLVTWSRQEDKHWFGGEIPAQIKSIEFVKVTPAPANGSPYTYEVYAGTPPSKKETDATASNDRIHFILGMHASVMP